jgi:hypothetical protein
MGQAPPVGYVLQYEQSFHLPGSVNDFRSASNLLPKLGRENDNLYLRISSICDTAKIAWQPCNLTILNNQVYGDFILEADFIPAISSTHIKDIGFLLSLKNDSVYYCVRLSNDPQSNGAFIKKNAPIRKLNGPNPCPMDWKNKQWHKVRIERNIVKRTLAVFLDNQTQPVVHLKDFELIMGSIGFASFTGTIGIDNIKIWAPTVIRNHDLQVAAK